jgi:hypothetical protein
VWAHIETENVMSTSSENPRWFDDDQVLFEVIASAVPPEVDARHRKTARTAVSWATLDADLRELASLPVTTYDARET